MESETHHRKLEEIVIGILKSADLETATELSVRTTAAELLGVDLSDIVSKRLVRRVVESFLLSSSSVDEVREETEEVVEEAQLQNSPVDDRKTACDDGGGRVICKLSGMRRVSIQKFKGTPLVSIREYSQKDGKVFPSGRGISLNSSQWSAFRSSFPDIEEAIVKMESRIRAKGIDKKKAEAEAEASELQHVPVEKMQNEADTLVPIATTRLTGKNYYWWKHQMQFFLDQLKISYVLVQPCPDIPVSPEASFEKIPKVKVNAQRWMNDDYLCRHTILNSLSDHIFDIYSAKTCSARELWDELNSVYGYEIGTKRSHVNNYINFEIVDGISVVEQVELLHRIADAITASGIYIDENFHVSAIISKLPLSWKNIRSKLMEEEYLPLHKLIYWLKEEEEFRSKKRDRFGRKKEMKRVCYGCGKEGHLRRDCPFQPT